MTFRYIGSKQRLVDALADHIGHPHMASGRFVDLFCGTGVVAEAAASNGWAVLLNDHLHCAVTMAGARVLGRSQVPFKQLGGYEAAVEHLNVCPERQAAMWSKYSPASLALCGVERRYFTEENAARLDGVRAQIARWAEQAAITRAEEILLLGDLLSAANRAANIAGTYGCFLSKWQEQAKRPVRLVARELKDFTPKVEVSVADVFDVRLQENDVAYLDPPYSKRQYASYYHLLETLTLGDDPEVSGVCGLRPWRDKSSPFCFKLKALRALVRLIEQLETTRVLISYSDEGHIQLDELQAELKAVGRVRFVPLVEIGRYRPNKTASSNGSAVTEYLLVLEKHIADRKQAVNE